jgi:hypothetical protein
LSGGIEEKTRQFCQYDRLPGREFNPALLNLESGVLTTCPRRPVVLNTSKTLVFKFKILSDKVELKIYCNLARHLEAHGAPSLAEIGKLKFRAVHRGRQWRGKNKEFFDIYYPTNALVSSEIFPAGIVKTINPLNTELNPICHLLALL